MISTHNSAANRTRIGHDRSSLCFRGTPSAGNAMVMTIPSSAKAQARSAQGGQPTASHPEDLRVARLDLLAHALDAGGIVLPQLDLVEPARPRLLLGEGVDRMLTGKIDQELLRLERMQPV